MLLEVHNLSVAYGDIEAVRDLAFNLDQGELVAAQTRQGAAQGDPSRREKSLDAEKNQGHEEEYNSTKHENILYNLDMQPTYRPHKRKRAKTIGFRARMSTPGGRGVLNRRRAKGRRTLVNI